MNDDSIISKLEEEWHLETGFLGRLRTGDFDTAGLRRLLSILHQIALPHEISISRRLVSLLWYIPIFMQWQKDRVGEAGGDLVSFEKAANEISSLLERILGTP